MACRLYLDTARMGRMSPRAQRAQMDFVRLAAEEGCSLYWEKLLEEGFSAWPNWMQRRFPGLSDWRGIDELKRSLVELTGCPPATSAYLANRSAQLLQLGVGSLLNGCRRVLVTDLSWPNYARVLDQERAGTDTQLAVVPVRRAILSGRATLRDVVAAIVGVYRQAQCDSLFLPAVSHDGIRLPLKMIYRAVSRISTPKFVLIDGAQAFCHAPVDLRGNWCDFYVAGCHKWLGAYLPMGIALLPRAASHGNIAQMLASLIDTRRIVDPLLAFDCVRTHDLRPRFSETVNFAAAISCRASVAQWQAQPYLIESRFTQRLANAHQLAYLAARSGWQVLQPTNCFRSAILLMRTPNWRLRATATEDVRTLFHDRGVTVTTYPSGIVRLSMPFTRWSLSERHKLSSVFTNLGRRPQRSLVGSTSQNHGPNQLSVLASADIQDRHQDASANGTQNAFGRQPCR